MATFNLYLTNPKGKEKARVSLHIFHSGKRFRISTPYSVEVDRWQVEEQRCGSKRKTTPKEKLVNDNLEIIKDKAEAFFLESLKLGRIPSKEEIEQAIEAEDTKEEVQTENGITVEAAFEEFLATPSLSSGKKRKGSTLRSLPPMMNKLKEYAAKNRRFKLEFENFDNTFYTNYVAFLEEQGLENNSIGGHIKRLKTFLNWATEKGYNKSIAYNKFKVLKEAKPVIYLNKEELNALFQYDFSKTPRLSRVRDLFILQCSTGLRVSDLMELQSHHIFGEEKIQIRSQKTGGFLSIPLNNYSKAILQKHPDGLPKMSPQKYNDYLKEMGLAVGFSRMVEQHKTFGSQTTSTFVPLSESISSHTGRRTFITQCLERGMPPHTVMGITDHKDLRTMYKYVGYIENEKSQAMSLAWDS